MYEHVGRTELDRYAAAVAEAAAPGRPVPQPRDRAAGLQPDPTGHVHLAATSFPDGDLHPVTEIMDSMQAAGLEVRDVESLREHYPLTLRRWLATSTRAAARRSRCRPAARARLAALHVASAQGFEDGEISVYQVLAARLGADHRLRSTEASRSRFARRHARSLMCLEVRHGWRSCVPTTAWRAARGPPAADRGCSRGGRPTSGWPVTSSASAIVSACASSSSYTSSARSLPSCLVLASASSTAYRSLMPITQA